MCKKSHLRPFDTPKVYLYEITKQCTSCADGLVLWNPCYRKTTVTVPLWSLRVYSEIFSTSHCWKCTQSRQILNLSWHMVTPDDARISNKTGEWLCRIAKAAPAPQWIVGINTHISLPLTGCNRTPMSLKLALIELYFRSEMHSWLMGQ